MYLPLRNSRVKLPQGQIFWHEIGQGPHLVFLHGSWHDSSQWLPTIEQLSLEHHCFAPDLLGFGDSEYPKAHYSVELEVECLAGYLETLKLRKVYLIGHSLGCWVAASYAVKYAEQVRGLVLVSPEGVKAGQVKQRWLAARWLASQPPIAFWAVRSLYPLAKMMGWQTRFDEWLELRRHLLQCPASPQLLFQRKRAEIQAELLDDRLPWLKVPTLILQGAQDRPATLAMSQSYAALLPSAELRSIAAGGNNLPQQVPHTVAQHIREFVRLY